MTVQVSDKPARVDIADAKPGEIVVSDKGDAYMRTHYGYVCLNDVGASNTRTQNCPREHVFGRILPPGSVVTLTV